MEEWLLSMTSPVRLSSIVGGGYGSYWNSRKRYRVLKGGKVKVGDEATLVKNDKKILSL